MHLPSVTDATIPRPGANAKKVKQCIPNPEYSEFWEHWYQTFRRTVSLAVPVSAGSESVDPIFGHFGMRYHPVIKKPAYFHAGLDMTVPPKTSVFPMLPGILEYAGFGAINGNYVVLSHPDVVTDDGFVFMTSVMHLKECLVGFTSYQKMLREISLHTYPQIPLNNTTPLGKTGNSGMVNGYHSHVHIQCELYHKATNTSVLLDPAQLLGFTSGENLSKDIRTDAEFVAFKDTHASLIHQFGLGQYWKQD